MNYIVFGPSFNAADRLFDDIKTLKNVKYVYYPIQNKLIQFLHPRILKRMNVSFLNFFWRRFFIKQLDDDWCIYLYIGAFNVEIAESLNYIDFIREKYSKSYHVAYLADIHSARKLNVESLKKKFDKLYIFDKMEAKRLDISHYPLPYSVIKPQTRLNGYKIKEADLYFVGQAKSRYMELIQIFEYCEFHDITTNFYIIGVPKKEQKYQEKIHYIDFVPYDQALAVMQKSNCGLELKVEGVDSFSNRVYEAILNSKKLISNNKLLEKEKFFDKEKMMIFSNIEDIKPEFVKEKMKSNGIVKNEYSPIIFLKKLEDSINK